MTGSHPPSAPPPQATDGYPINAGPSSTPVETSARPVSARITPLPDDERDAETQQLLDAVKNRQAKAIYETIARHPKLFRRFSAFGAQMLAGELPGRDRELVILRTAWRCQAEYEWGQHVLIAKSLGLTDDEIASVNTGAVDPRCTQLERALLKAVDELHDDSCITDKTWSALRTWYNDQQLIELTMLVGLYHMVAYTLNSLGVQREPGIPGF